MSDGFPGYREEMANVQRERPTEPPPLLGRTVLAGAPGSSSAALLERVRQAWAVIATWGRWRDEALGDWIATSQARAALPDWLRAAWGEESAFASWLDDLHDREWIWWSGAVVGDGVKIDILAESEPLSLCPLRVVIEAAGGAILHQDRWRAVDELAGGGGA